MRQLIANLTLEHVIFTAALLVLVLGLRAPLAQYISPQSGLGYALGITGGSMMLLLNVYPLRKRFKSLGFLGGVRSWFRVHMILGVLGPVCILFHSNFSLGATNSNVALFCMLVVSGSGIVGRYFYSKIHHGLYGQKTTLAELQARSTALKDHDTHLPMLPQMIALVEREERRMLAWGAVPLAAPVAPVALRILLVGARWRLGRYIRRTVETASRSNPVIAGQSSRVIRVARDYTERRLMASKKVAELQIYERLFSLWHVLHLPLFFMLLVAGIVHVFAANVY